MSDIPRLIQKRVGLIAHRTARQIDEAVLRASLYIAQFGEWVYDEYRLLAVGVVLVVTAILVRPYGPSERLYTPAALVYTGLLLCTLYRYSKTPAQKKAFAIILLITFAVLAVLALLFWVSLIAASA